MATQVQANVNRFDGLAEVYNNARPKPPPALLQILPQIVNQNASGSKLKRVLDIGCGPGNSTWFWAEHALEIVGVEPNRDFLAFATKTLALVPNPPCKISFKEGNSINTGQPDNSVDLITMSQALHWMEPQATFKEAHRILRPGGVLAAFDCDWPPTTVSWEAENAFDKCRELTTAAGDKHLLFADVKHWDKESHLQRMRESGLFRHVKEIVVHHQEMGNSKRLVDLFLSQGEVGTALKSKKVTKEEIGFNGLSELCERTLGSQMQPWYFSYRVRIAVK